MSGESQRLAQAFRRDPARFPRGSLWFWGVCFGRPGDNLHRIVACEAEAGSLRLEFDQGEELLVEAPEGIELAEDSLKIHSALRLRWEWHDYARPDTPENRFHEEYRREGDGIQAETDAPWQAVRLRPDPSAPAVELA